MPQDDFLQFIEDQLRALGGVQAKAMFGGYGLYHHEVFFGIVYRDQLYFKTDEKTQLAYIAQKMKPFRPSAKQVLITYYEVPPDLIEDQDMLVSWAKEAIECQKKSKRRAR